MRIGSGFDAHAFAPGRSLVLGGVAIKHPDGLTGHSDGDVVAHAIADAILGAAGLGDLGEHFPATDEWKDRSSMDILDETVRLAAKARWKVGNVDVTVIAQAPSIAPHVDEMKAAVATALGVKPKVVSVKATTTDSMGFTGRGEGIAALAVALLVPA